MIIVASGIVLHQDWGFFVFVKGLVSFPLIYIFKKQIGYLFAKFFKFLKMLSEIGSKQNDKKIKDDN
jgi:hypothetical protein